MWVGGFSVSGKWTERLVQDQSLLKMALGKCFKLTAELLPPKRIDPLDLAGPQLKQKKSMNVKSKPIVQVLKGSSWKSEPGLGVRIAPKHTTCTAGHWRWFSSLRLFSVNDKALNKTWDLLYLIPGFCFALFLMSK